MLETYTSRPMWLKKETAYEIAQDGLILKEQGGVSKTVAWGDIASVRIHWSTPKNQPRVHFCQITLKGHQFPVVHFTQLRFQGIMSFLDQSAAYNEFVRTLTERIAAAAPHVKFWTGAAPIERAALTGLLWAPAAAALVFGALGLVRIVDLDGINLPLVLLALGAGGAWLGWKLYGWNAPKLIDPRALPQDLLAPV